MSPGAERETLAVLERTGPYLRRILSWHGIPADDAEDLKQEAFLALVRCWDGIDNPDGWLIGAVSRLCRKYHVKRKQRGWLQALDARILEALALPREPEQRQFEILWDLRILLRHLRKRERLILRLRFQGLSCAEMAERLGCRTSSVSKLSSRAMAQARAVARGLGRRSRSS
jgi:RNA polymerase sigma factor (sigma-70 family)